MMRRPPFIARDDRALSTIVGAVIVLAVIGLAIMMVNTMHVPRQGASLEMAAREDAAQSLVGLSARLSTPAAGDLAWDVPLRAPPAPPALLAGVILSPARAEGTLAFNASATRITISHVVDAPPGGVPANDSMRTAEPGNRMRVHLLGNATAGQPVGALSARVGGAYAPQITFTLSGGLVLRQEPPHAPAPLEALGLRVARVDTPTGPLAHVAWHVPLLAGTGGETSGAAAAVVALDAGPTTRIAGETRAHELTIRIATTAVDAWRMALTDAAAGLGTVTVTAGPTPSEGVVTLTVASPAGASGAAVRADLQATMYALTMGARVS